MPEIKWNLLKSERLKKTRGVSFEEILQGKLIAIKKHSQKNHQEIMLFDYRKYVWVVPYVKEKSGDIFLKTLYPSRKYTKTYKEQKS